MSDISHSLRVYVNVWTLVIDKLLFLNQYNIHNPFAVVVHKGNNLVWPEPLLHGAFITCSISTHAGHLNYFGVSSCNVDQSVLLLTGHLRNILIGSRVF